ncbi:translocation/assembly module TamB domain-containing protein [Roseospira navarrensis]|uniref:Translocation and assembly module TamB C-terminal domain-containing protein n=1 Tax=Roseospira navarrensis TaxID=140058 RepID=A0A7X2D2U7_9PROT|nr:translocation/assembly module TamB domain-containing protein [Roseospira navarrensis]MQX36096.1 hypothetical protein [Roseospira navarrensis]
MADPADRMTGAPHRASPTDTPPPHRRRRRWWRALAWVGVGLLVLLAGLAGAGWWVMRTDDGRAWLTATVLDLVNDSEGLTVRLGALEGDLPFSLRLRDLSVTDPEGEWLSAERLSLAWDPWGLLGGRLHVTEVGARALSVERPPALPPSDPPDAPDTDGGGFDPRLLGLLRVDRIALEGVYLGAPLVGQPVLMDVTGRVAGEGDPSDPDAVTATLSARRIDGRPLEVSADIRLDGPDLERLALDLQASEGQGGMVTTLAGLPGAAGWSVDLSGEGPLDDWGGSLNAEAEGLAVLSGSLLLDLGDPAAPAIVLDLNAQPREAAPPAWRAVLTERFALGLSAALDGDGRVSLDGLRLASDALEVTGSAALDPGADSGEGTVSARLEGTLSRPDLLAPLAALPLARGALTVTAEGALMAPTVTASVRAEDLNAGVGARRVTLDLTATPDGPLDGETATVGFDLTGRVEDLSGPDAVTGLFPRPLDLTARGRASLADQRVTLESLRLSDDGGVTLEAAAVATLAPALDVSADATLTLEALARLSPVLGGLEPQGSGVLALSGVTVDADTVVSGDVRLTLADAALGIQQADAALGPTPELTGRVTFDPAEGLSVADLRLDGGALDLNGRLAIPADFATLDADLTARLTDAGAVAGDAVGGALTLDARLSGPLGDPDIDATARMPAATLAGMAWDDLTLTADLSGLARGPSGPVTLSGTGPGGALDLSAGLALPGYGRAEVSDLSLTVPGATLTGQATTDFATTLSDGALALSVARPGDLAGWGAPPLSGSLTADVALNAREDGTQAVTLTATAPQLALADAGVSMGALDLRAALTDALGTPALDATVAARGGEAGGVSWERLDVTARGPLADLSVTADLTGEGPTGPLTLATAARVQPPGLAEPGRVVLDRLDLETRGHAIVLRQPATLDLDTGPRVDRLVLTLDDGALTVSGGLTEGGALDVSVTGDGLPLALADLAAPDMTLGGRLDLSASLTGRLPTPEGSLSLTARDVALAGTGEVPPLAAEVSGRLSGGRLTADATVSGFDRTPARVTADVPLRLGGAAPIPEGEPLSVSARWNGPVESVWEMLPMVVEHRLAGDLVLDADVSGTLAAPAITADVRLSNGRYEHLTVGTLIDDLSLSASAQGTDQVVVSLSGTDGAGGRLSGEGDIRLTPDGPVGTVSTTLNDAVLVRRDDVTASADADLSVSLEGDRGAVEGRIRTREVRVRLENLSGGASVSTLDVVEIDTTETSGLDVLDRAAAEARAAGETDEQGAFPISLAIDVDMPNRIYVTGRGLESEWQGSLQVRGTAAVPRVTGTISVRRGSLEAVGKQLAIETGQVQFVGGARIDPLLDVVALYETEEVEARVGLRGPASDPEFILESVPPLPRDEVLSQILFDKATGELTTLETVQLARALGTLTGITGGGGGLDVLGAVRGTLGLDVLKVGGDVAAGGAGVEAGRYIGDDIYVGVEQGLESGSGGVSVEVDLGAGFKVESKARRSGTGEVGVIWKRDY